MSNKKPKYIYDKSGAFWYVYEMEYFKCGSLGQKLTGDPLTKEEAKQEVYRLNGWK